MRATDFVFEVWASKANQTVFFTGSLAAMVTYDDKIMDESYLAIISLSNDTKLLSLSDTEWFYDFIK